MKKNYLIALFAMICSFASAQIEPTTYKGAFAPAPAVAWTNSWTNFDPNQTDYPASTVTVAGGNINTDTTWTSGNTYTITGPVYVRNGATLTIQPGTVIYGANSTASLIITKGSKINAAGTVSSPIVFTSSKVKGSRAQGDWGGVIVLGNASYNINSGTGSIEGIEVNADTAFGGGLSPNNADNSGVMQYVRIEFSGVALSTTANSEINGLTMGAVGSGTTIDHIQVSYNGDDAFEWFGGSVNCKYLVALGTYDDDFDTDNGYNGNVQFGLVVRNPQLADSSKSNVFESDNNATSVAGTSFTSAVFSNITVVGPTKRQTLTNGGTLNSNYQYALHLRRNTKLKVYNSVFMDNKLGLYVDGPTTAANAVAGDLVFSNNIIAGTTTASSDYGTTTAATFTSGIASWYTAGGNTAQASSNGLLTKAYDTDALIYTGLDFRPAAVTAPTVVSASINYVVGNVANPLSATAASGNTLNWYTVATGGTASTTAPTPATTVAGTTTYYVSQTSVMGVESARTAIVVTVDSLLTLTSYRGAFAPAPAVAWTNSWTNFDPNQTDYPASTVTVAGGNINTDTTWTSGNTYTITGPVYVRNGATLTIQPGTVIYGANSTASLIITKGSKINAAGTVSSPIVFTSSKVKGSRAQGDWGGVIVLGNASYNINSGTGSIEGIEVNADTAFGGGLSPNNADNSGVMQYVRIEFSGVALSTTANSEINGLTMGAVGSGTTIDHIQVSYNGDDAFEWFGGSVNCKYLVALGTYDDDFDTDNGYNGNVQFGLVVRNPQLADSSKSNVFESDNNATSVAGTSFTSAVFSNITVVGPTKRQTLTNGGTLNSNYQYALHLRRNTKLKVTNSVFMDNVKGLYVDGATTATNAVAGDLKFTNNIIAGTTTASSDYGTTTAATFTSGIAAWYTAGGNTTQASSNGLLTFPYDTDALIYTGLDFRPATASALLSGASFADFSSLVSIAAPGVSNVSYDRGATAVALTATTTDSAATLKWYTVPTAGTAATTAPTPATSAIGTTTYYVSQTIAGIESARVAITVTVNAIPLPAPVIANKTFCKGDVSTFDSAYAAFGTTLKYFTTATGATAMTGAALTPSTATAGTKTYWVLQTDGTTSSTRSTFTVTNNALPATPTLLVLTNDAAVLPATSATAIKTVGVYVGQDVTLKLTATAVGANTYLWTLPTGVTLSDGTTTGAFETPTNTINVKFSASADTSSLIVSVKSVNINGCKSLVKTLTLTRASSVAPANLKMYNGLTLTPITSFAKYMGTNTVLRLSSAVSATATSYVWQLPTGVTRVTGLNDLTAIASLESTLPEIFVTFNGVTSSNSFNYSTTATVPVSINVLRIGVYGKNGTGLSTTVNAALVNPVTSSTARLLTLTAIKPLAPSSLKMYDLAVSATAAVTGITKYVNTETELKLEAKASVLASSYTWYLSEGVNVTNNSAEAVIGSPNTYTSTSNVITVNFWNVPHEGAFSLVLGVKAANGVGESVSTNAAPNASRTDRLLTLTAVLPTVPGAVTGSLKICATTASSVTYTIAALAANARDYLIEVPEGCTITSLYPGGNVVTSLDNFSGTPAVANAYFTVNYPAGFVVTTANPKTIIIKSFNYVGTSATNKVLTLTNVGATCGGRIAPEEAAVAEEFSVKAYPNPSSSEFTIETSAKGAINAKVYDMQGRLVESTTSTQVGSSLAPGIYNVIVSQGANTTSVRVIKK